MTQHKTRTLGAVLYPQFELLDLYGPLEMFGSIGAELRIVTVAEKTGPVASFQRPKTVAEFDFASAPMLDLILLPGGFGTIPQLETYLPSAPSTLRPIGWTPSSPIFATASSPPSRSTTASWATAST
jgi:putative intracellular protease/amidase